MDTRVCKKCNVEKSLKSFVANKTCKYGREWRCNTCKNRSARDSKGYRKGEKRIKDKIWKIKERGCSACGEMAPETIDFHHKNPEDKSGNIERIKTVPKIKEILKCCLVCANCHRKIHAGTLDDSELPLVTKEMIEEDTGITILPSVSPNMD